MGIEVSVIIVNYNTSELLDNCIDSVQLKTEDVDYEIIVVDNNSEKGSLDHLIKKYPTVNFIFSEENLGFGRANNLGVSYANGKYLFFLNPDTLLINNAILILLNYIENDSQVGICGGNLYEEDLTPALSYYEMSPYSRYTQEWLTLLGLSRPKNYHDDNRIKAVRAIIGADLLIRKEVFDTLGGFDPDFFMYFEELYLCNRVRESGYKIVAIPEAQIIHIGGAAAENKDEELHKWSYQEHWYSRFIYFHKTEGRSKTTLIYYGHILKLKIATLVYSIKKSPEKIDYWKKKSEVLKKTYSRYCQYLKR
ncbi:glycosyltransferase family 2 protein [Dysgonomonas reticulitermitis]